MKEYITISCPHCGKTREYLTGAISKIPKKRLVTCELHEDGCGYRFKLQYWIEVKHTEVPEDDS